MAAPTATRGLKRHPNNLWRIHSSDEYLINAAEEALEELRKLIAPTLAFPWIELLGVLIDKECINILS